jgi:peptidoglycan pentaglycine glycine transferase (the first glycine)
MSALTITPIDDRTSWNYALRQFETAHILQTWEWGEFKRATTGWEPLRWAFRRDGQIVALISLGVRRVGPFALMYAPKGFVCAPDDLATAEQVLAHLERFSRRQPTVWLKIDPDIVLATGLPNSPDDLPHPTGQRWQALLMRRGWRFSADQVQFRNTLCIDLTRDEDALLAAMSQNTRRKVRAAEKHGVTIRTGTLADLPLLYSLYQITGERDGFLIRPYDYYQRAWRDFMEDGLAHALIAELHGHPIAHVILLHFGRKCWYFYGASSNDHREAMPNYALQWAAIRWAKAQGYAVYDMWGAPDDFVETDPLWGVYEFKRGFRGTITRHLGAWDYAPFPPLYWGYTRAVPALRGVSKWLPSPPVTSPTRRCAAGARGAALTPKSPLLWRGDLPLLLREKGLGMRPCHLRHPHAAPSDAALMMVR